MILIQRKKIASTPPKRRRWESFSKNENDSKMLIPPGQGDHLRGWNSWERVQGLCRDFSPGELCDARAFSIFWARGKEETVIRDVFLRGDYCTLSVEGRSCRLCKVQPVPSIQDLPQRHQVASMLTNAHDITLHTAGWTAPTTCHRYTGMLVVNWWLWTTRH